MKKLFLMMLACLMLVPINTVHAASALLDPNDLLSPSVVVTDATTNRILFEKNGKEKHFPASTTKILTMLLALEKLDLNDTITMSRDAIMSVEEGSSHIGLEIGETMPVRDMLLGVGLRSANDGANGIAEKVAGSLEAFADMMNQRALELGCTDSHFVNAHGLHDEDHYTTAYDLCKIMAEVSKHKEFLDIMGTLETTVPATNKNDARDFYIQNRCMDPEDPRYYIPEIKAGKSGFTDEAGHTFVTYLEKGDMKICIALMDATWRNDIYDDLMKISEACLSTLKASKDFGFEIEVPNVKKGLFATGGETHLEKGFDAMIIDGALDRANLKLEATFEEDAKQKAVGDKVGTLNLVYEGEVLQSRNIILDKEVKTYFSIALHFLLNLLKWLAIILAILVVGVLIAREIYQRFIKKRHPKNRKQN